MIIIESSKCFKEEIKSLSKYCIFFGKDNLPKSNIMLITIKEICKKYNYILLYLDIKFKKLFNLLKEYNVDILPYFIFVRGNNLIYKNSGITLKRTISSQLKKEKQ